MMRQWEWRSVWGSGRTCARHTNVVVVQWLMLEASIAMFARRHPARQSDTILWMTWLLVAFQQLAFPSPRNPQACLVPTGNARWTFPRSLPKRQGALLGCDSHLSVSRLILSAAARDAGAAAELAASRKELKYAGLDGRYVFAPIAFENLGVPSASARHLISDLGRRLTDISGESRETIYLLQRFSVLVQRFNAVLLHDSLPDLDCTDRHT